MADKEHLSGAIDADALIDKTDDRYSLHEIGRRERDDIVDALEYAPTIQPEPKRGKWNRLDMDTFNCNKCGTTFVLNQGSEKMHFCPNCGANMRGEKDE